jgi:hypothetical protein
MPLSENKIRVIIYTFLWTVYAIVHALSMYFLVTVSFWTLFADALCHSVLFAFLGVLLWIVLQHGKYETLIPFQRIMNYGALALIVVVLWVGIGYGLDYIFLDENETIALLPTLPVKGLVGLMLYVIFVLYFYVDKQQDEEEPFAVKNYDVLPQGIETKKYSVLWADKESVETGDVSVAEEIRDEEILERIVVKTKQQIKVIVVSDIIYLRSEGDYVMIITKEGKYLKEQTMKYFESHLPKSLFIRVHRSYIINIEYLSAIESYGKQNQQILLKNGEWLKVSLAGYRALKAAIR